MQFHDVSYGAALPVDSYGPDFFRIGGQVMHGPILLFADKCQPWHGYGDTDQILALGQDIDVLLLGTGQNITHPPLPFREALATANIGIEQMATTAACRTYNVLLSEGRRVALAALTSAM